MIVGRGPVPRLPPPLDALASEIIACNKCPRLRAYCTRVARIKKREFRAEEYWGQPVPGFGDPAARVLIIGLAPAAHGANRTGRMFTGDSSGAWLYRALHKAGFANQPTASSRHDGLKLNGVYISASARCAPPDNKPMPREIANCRPYLEREIELLTDLSVVVCLGGVAFRNYLRILRDRGVDTRGREFGHGKVHRFDPISRGGPPTSVGMTASAPPGLVASYHPSRQNTNTGKLTESMFDAVFARVRSLLSP